MERGEREMERPRVRRWEAEREEMEERNEMREMRGRQIVRVFFYEKWGESTKQDYTHSRSGNPTDVIEKCWDEDEDEDEDEDDGYGPIMLLHFGQVPVVVVSSSSLAEEIFKTHDADFSSRSPMTTAKILMYGCVDIGFSPYNESRQLRKICVMELLSVRTVKTFKTVREEEVACLIETISRSSSKGASVNLSAMSHILTVHIIFRCAFGRKFSNVDGQNGFADLPKELMSGLLSFSFTDSIPTLGWLDIVTGLITRLKKTAQKLDSFLEQVIEEHIIQSSSSSNDLDKAKDFVDDMFVAGTDSFSKVIEWAMSELITNPRIMKKAQEEVRRIVREKGKLKLDEEDIQEMDYLKCVIKETFRLHPPTPILARESSESVNIKGYLFPPKTKVIINAWKIQRDPDTWSCAEEFIPELVLPSRLKVDQSRLRLGNLHEVKASDFCGESFHPTYACPYHPRYGNHHSSSYTSLQLDFCMSRPSPRNPQQERRTIEDMEKDMISDWLSPSTKKYPFDDWSNSLYQQDTYSSMRNQPSRDIIRFLLETEQDMNLTEQELDQWIE
ncbi:hypothetical protein Sjap_013240 [Stephania japonica]|uniref:Cytochrome P450 n=1 Tax=Stephania japonica TaxID=461633 RepID=A0AAP0NYF4_9MAGN